MTLSLVTTTYYPPPLNLFPLPGRWSPVRKIFMGKVSSDQGIKESSSQITILRVVTVHTGELQGHRKTNNKVPAKDPKPGIEGFLEQ